MPLLSQPSQRTWSVNDVVSGAEMNSNVRDSVNYLASPPIMGCYQATGQAVGASSWSAILFDTNVVDTYNGHSTSTNTSRYTAAQSGWYKMHGIVAYPANSTGYRSAAFWINGVLVPYSRFDEPGPTTVAGVICPIEDILYLNVGDYIEVQAFHTATATLTTSSDRSCMEALWVHT